jgi:hypothetical protein
MLDLISFETKPKWGGIPVSFPDDSLGLPYRLGYAIYYLRHFGYETFHS